MRSTFRVHGARGAQPLAPPYCALLTTAWIACLSCRGEGAIRLQGHWRGVRVESATGEVSAQASAFARGTELDVRGDVLTITTPNETQSGHYRVAREDGKSVTLTTDKDGIDSPQTFTLLDGATLRWPAVPGRAIVFSKR